MEKHGICLNGPERGIFDLTHAKAEMMKFMDRFDQQDPAIALRRTHTLRVVEEARFLGSRLHMSKSEIEVAELVALLHDYGRFLPEGKSMDHGSLAAERLFHKGEIRRFTEESTYDGVIEAAIYYHNKAAVDPHLYETAHFFADFIRDCDKLDILAVRLSQQAQYEREAQECLFVSEAVMSCFQRQRYVKNELRKTKLDEYVAALAFVFDMRFIVTLQEVRKRSLIEKLLQIKVPASAQKQLYLIEEQLNAYLAVKLEGYGFDET